METFKDYVEHKSGILWDSLPADKLEEYFRDYKYEVSRRINRAEGELFNAYFMVQDVKNGERGPITKEDRERYNRMLGGHRNV